MAISFCASAQMADTSMNRHREIAVRNLNQYKGLHYAACGVELVGGILLYSGVKSSTTDNYTANTIHLDSKVYYGAGMIAVGLIAQLILPAKLKAAGAYINGSGVAIPLK